MSEALRDGSSRVRYVRIEAAARLVRVSPVRIRHDIQAGLLMPSRIEGEVLMFGDVELARMRKIRRLRRDLGLNTAGVEVALRLLDEIEALRGRRSRHSAR